MKLDDFKEEHEKQCKFVFNKFDAKQNGTIPAKSVYVVLQILGGVPTVRQVKEELEKLKIDTARGFIEFEDFLGIAVPIMYPSKWEREADIWNAFLTFDSEDKGRLDPERLFEIFAELGEEPFPLATAKKLIKVCYDRQTEQSDYAQLIRSWNK